MWFDKLSIWINSYFNECWVTNEINRVELISDTKQWSLNGPEPQFMMATQAGSVRNLKTRETEELRGFQKAALDFSFLEHAPDINGIINHHRPIHESIANEYSNTSEVPHQDIIVSGSYILIYAYVLKYFAQIQNIPLKIVLFYY